MASHSLGTVAAGILHAGHLTAPPTEEKHLLLELAARWGISSSTDGEHPLAASWNDFTRRTPYRSYAGVSVALLAILAAPCLAQTKGATSPTGRDSGRLDHGGNLQIGAGYFFNRFLGLTGNFMFNQLGLNVPDGNSRVYNFTVDPTLRLPVGQNWNVYLLAGGGYLRRTVEFTQPTVAQTFVFDPWSSYFGPVLVPANQILGSVTSDAGAYNVGAGINIPLPVPRLHLFLESRYIHGFVDRRNTMIVPITVGL